MFILTHRDRVFDPLCCCAIETVLQICFGNFTSSLVQNGQRCTIRILRKTNCFILKTRLNLMHPAELMKDAAGIFLIWEFKNVWLHCQRSPARAFYVKLQIFHQPGWQSRATLEETTTKKKKTRANQMQHRWFDLCLYQRETWYTYQCCCHFVSCLKCNS